MFFYMDPTYTMLFLTLHAMISQDDPAYNDFKFFKGPSSISF